MSISSLLCIRALRVAGLITDMSISILLYIRALRVAGLITDTRCSTAHFGLPLMKFNLRFL
jgi:hypothetical protein